MLKIPPAARNVLRIKNPAMFEVFPRRIGNSLRGRKRNFELKRRSCRGRKRRF